MKMMADICRLHGKTTKNGKVMNGKKGFRRLGIPDSGQ